MLALVVAAVLSSEPQIKVVPFCHLAKDGFTALVELAVSYRGGDAGTQSEAVVVSVGCDLKTKKCNGTQLRLEAAMREGKIGFGQLNTLGNMSLVSLVGRVAVVSWGGNQFVVDFDAGAVTLTYGGSTDRGVGRCK